MDPMDSYSRTVSTVAARVTPHVASVALARGSGSAVVFSDDGLLLTNAHVIGPATAGTVAFTDGTESRFDVVGTDPLSDLAVSRAHGSTPRAVQLGDADGRVRRAYLGLVGVPTPLPADVAERTGQSAGLRLVEVVSGSPADRAGLRSGDLVLSAGRRAVTDAQGIQRLLFSEAIGTTLPITALRNGAMVDVMAVPSELVGA